MNRLADLEKPMKLASLPPWLEAETTQAVFQLIHNAGHVVRVVGGCVRDTLLSASGSPDIDMATTMLAQDLMDLCRTKDMQCLPTGLSHGTVTLRLFSRDGTPHTFEVTTLRKDIATDGRHAEVAFTDDWLEDAKRRDLTINALYMDAIGQVYDPLAAIDQSGLTDLKQTRIRFIGDAEARIQEDYLRILRFFRFHYRFAPDQAMDAHGLAACITFRSGLDQLSRERVRGELLSLLALSNFGDAVIGLNKHDVMEHILGMKITPDRNMIERLSGLNVGCDPILRLGVLLNHGREVMSVRDALRLSNAETSRLGHLWDEMLQRDILGCRNQPDDLFVVCYRYSAQAVMDQLVYIWIKFDTAPANAQALLLQLAKWERPDFPLSGQDFLNNDYAAGPELGEAFKAYEDQWARSHFKLTRDELLSRLLSDKAGQ